MTNIEDIFARFWAALAICIILVYLIGCSSSAEYPTVGPTVCATPSTVGAQCEAYIAAYCESCSTTALADCENAGNSMCPVGAQADAYMCPDTVTACLAAVRACPADGLPPAECQGVREVFGWR